MMLTSDNRLLDPPTSEGTDAAAFPDLFACIHVPSHSVLKYCISAYVSEASELRPLFTVSSRAE